MFRLYIFGALFVGLATAYFCGRAIGVAHCRAEMSRIAVQGALQAQTDLIQTKAEINAESVIIGGDDVRRWLRENYTIAE